MDNLIVFNAKLAVINVITIYVINVNMDGYYTMVIVFHNVQQMVIIEIIYKMSVNYAIKNVVSCYGPLDT